VALEQLAPDRRIAGSPCRRGSDPLQQGRVDWIFGLTGAVGQAGGSYQSPRAARYAPPVADTTPKVRPGDPYCSKCGYILVGLHDASRCPECGTSFVDGLIRGRRDLGKGQRYTSEARIFGLPVISVAFGPNGEEPEGKARGFIALGDQASGFVAIGGRARGVVALGGVCFGVFTAGGASFGLISASGGAAFGGIAAGGAAIGGMASGGAAIGFIASGGAAIGFYARGNGALGQYVVRGARRDPEAVSVFATVDPILGVHGGIPQVLVVQFGTLLTLLVAAVLVMAWALRRHDRRTGRQGSAS
jgi:hypothetical protein